MAACGCTEQLLRGVNTAALPLFNEILTTGARGDACSRKRGVTNEACLGMADDSCRTYAPLGDFAASLASNAEPRTFQLETGLGCLNTGDDGVYVPRETEAFLTSAFSSCLDVA